MSFLDLLALAICLTILFGPPIAIIIAGRRVWKERCRLHLSTVIVLVMLAGTLLGTNLSKGEGETRLRIGTNVKTVRETHIGFPFRAQIIAHLAETPSDQVFAADIDE